MTIGEYIRLHRGEISQKDLATFVGISPQYLNDIEHNNRQCQNRSLLYSIAEWIHVDPCILLFYAGILPHVEAWQEYDDETIVEAFNAMQMVLMEGQKVRQS